MTAGRDPTFLPSGTGSRAGSVPDPGSTAGTARTLHEDGTWGLAITEPVAPPGTSSDQLACNIAGYLVHTVIRQAIAAAIDKALTSSFVLDFLEGVVLLIPGVDLLEPLVAEGLIILFDAITTGTIANWIAAQAADLIWDKMGCLIYEAIRSVGAWTDATVLAAVNAILGSSLTYIDVLEGIANMLTALGVPGLLALTNIGGLADYDCSHCGLGDTGVQAGPPATTNATNLEITDGTHIVKQVGLLSIAGAVVGGTSPHATLAISGLPAGAEGDLAYFHLGAWIVLPPGSPGQALLMDGADPAWGAIAAGGGGAATVLVVSDTSVKTITLWNGSSNNSPPAGWTAVPFDDSAWGNAIVPGCAGGTGDTSSQIWPESPALSGTEGVISREHATLPLGTITGATLFIAGQTFDGLWINGTLISGSTGNGVTLTVDPALLLPGQLNVIAAEIHRIGGGGTCAFYHYTLTITYGPAPAPGAPGGGLPAGAEGDLAYFHLGAWIVLPPGAAGTILTSDGTDPGYAAPADSTITVGVNGAAAVGPEHELNFVQGANTTLSVADNPTDHRIDVTIAALAATNKAGGQGGKVNLTLAAGTATATAAVSFAPALAAAPLVLVSSSDGRLIASAESITSSGFTARLTASAPLAAATSIAAVLTWNLGGLQPGPVHKVKFLQQFR